MPTCVAYGCSNRSGGKSRKQIQSEVERKITFHKLPKDEQRAKEWIKAIRRVGWTPSPKSSLCSEHFTENCFDRTSLCYVRLVEDAIPSIFPSFPSYLQKVQKKRKSPTKRKTTHGYNTVNSVQDILELGSNSPEELNMECSVTEIVSCQGKCISSPIVAAGSSSEEKLAKLKEKYQRKIKVLQQTKRRHKKKIASLENVVKGLKRNNFLAEDQLQILSSISESHQEILKREISKSKDLSIPRIYCPKLRTFALTLHYYSPRAYSYVRKEFKSCLPHPKTISKWYQSVSGNAGFTKEAFHAIKLIAGNSQYPILCSLVLDEMAIRHRVEYDGHEYYGYVDMGTGLEGDDRSVAKEALVLMLVSINGTWKVPVGYFLVEGVSGEQRANLVSQCLIMAHYAGVRVISVTFDGAPSNFAMAKELGCKMENNTSMKVFFNHPCTNEVICIFPDPCHMLKLVRNTFGEKHILYDGNNDCIAWNFLEQLNQLQEMESLHLANKLRLKHLLYFKQKMKVYLATQLLSRSVSIALRTCLEMKLDKFKGCEATVKFLEVFNDLFDILNSKNLKQPGYKKPMYSGNCENVIQRLCEIKSYIQLLKMSDGKEVLKSTRKTGFLGFIVCIESAILLYKDICQPKSTQHPASLLYFPIYKLSQDHLELFFGIIRMHGGNNNNPTARQFKSAYKKCLVHMELKETESGNAIPLEKITILNCSSSERVINMTISSGRLADDIDSVHEINNDLEYSLEVMQLTEFSHKVITYVAGFVVKHLNKVLKCEECLNALIGHYSDESYSLIKNRDFGGLIYPSTDVIKICRACEKLVRCALAESGGKFMLKRFTVRRLCNMVLENYIGVKVFETLEVHTSDQEPMSNHKEHLLRAVVEKYISVRVHYVCKMSIDTSRSKRQLFNKSILFSGN